MKNYLIDEFQTLGMDEDTRKAVEQLEAIRRSGKVNMLTEPQKLTTIAINSGFVHLVEHIEEHGNCTQLLDYLPCNNDESVKTYQNAIRDANQNKF